VQQIQTRFSALMRQVIASVSADKEGTLNTIAQVHDELVETNRLLQGRIDSGESIPQDEQLDMEVISTHLAASNLLCEAHDSPDPILFAEGQIRALSIAGMLDEIHDAYRDGDPQRMQSLRDAVGITLTSFAELVRGAA
jgi:hypothetical protein